MSRRALCLGPGLALVALMMAGTAPAVTLEDCSEPGQSFEAAFPSGITDTWAEIVLGELAEINAAQSEPAVQAILDRVTAEWSAYEEEPDPDGDGYAVSPQVMETHALLVACLTGVRSAEIESAAQEEEDPEAAMPEDDNETEDLSAPPTPIGSPPDWFASADYPATALREGRSASITYDVTVDAEGAPVGCQASGPPGNSDLELATCETVMAKARFNPAKDAAGRPVVGEVRGKISWAI
jgi:hypothetical protein